MTEPPERKRGAPVIVSRDWIETVKRRLDELGWTQGQLAKAIGQSNPQITRLYRGQATDVTVAAVAEVLGLTNPAPATTDEIMARWMEYGVRLRAASPEKFTRLLEITVSHVHAAEAEAGFMEAAGRPSKK